MNEEKEILTDNLKILEELKAKVKSVQEKVSKMKNKDEEREKRICELNNLTTILIQIKNVSNGQESLVNKIDKAFEKIIDKLLEESNL